MIIGCGCEWGFCSGGYFCRVLAERGLSVFFPFLIDHACDVLVVILSEVVQMILHAKNFVRDLGKCLRQPKVEMRSCPCPGWSHLSGNSCPELTTCTGTGLLDFISTIWGWKGYRSSGLTWHSRRMTDTTTTSSRDGISGGDWGGGGGSGLYTDIRLWMVMISVRQSVIILKLILI